MWELTADNALEYLRTRGWIGAGSARVEALGGGVSNLVLRVEAEGRLLVVKQSRPQLRTRDTWFSDIERVYREQEVMELLGPLLPPLAVPRVLFSDRADYVFVMEHAPAESVVWKQRLLDGEVDPATAVQAGRLLGIIHEVTGRDSALIERFADRAVFVQLRVDPFYRRVQERRPEVADGVAPLIAELLEARVALCHGDFSPKNLLVHRSGLTLVDYETAHLGEPAMDLGFFFSHLLLKAVHRHAERQAYYDLTRAAWRGYATAVRFMPLDELIRRGVGHLGVCLLARIDGTSPVDYLPQEPKREAVRAIARELLHERPGDWTQVLDCVERHLGAL
jgi:aminoglycoside phosphotransferase (APT) family kinase protein